MEARVYIAEQTQSGPSQMQNTNGNNDGGETEENMGGEE